LNVVFLSITLNILSFGITIRVSTASLIFAKPSSAFSALFFPSNQKGFVTTPIVNIPISLAIFAITGPAHVPVPPHVQSVMKTISVSCNIFLISASLSSADFLPISGFAPAHKPLVRFNPIFNLLPAKLPARSCASVLMATNSTPAKPSLIILLIALFPAPPTHKTLIFAPGMNSGFTSLITILYHSVIR
jgi:hypothetical protein